MNVEHTDYDAADSGYRSGLKNKSFSPPYHRHSNFYKIWVDAFIQGQDMNDIILYKSYFGNDDISIDNLNYSASKIIPKLKKYITVKSLGSGSQIEELAQINNEIENSYNICYVDEFEKLNLKFQEYINITQAILNLSLRVNKI